MHGFDVSLPLTNPVQVFALVMFVILVAPLLLARLRLPGLLGLILAGLLLGPHALGILERGPTMELLGMVGLLYIMFTAGLEFDLNEFDKHRHRSLIFGTITFIIPQVVGALLARSLLGFDWLAALLLGSVFASHTLLAYPVVRRLGLTRTEVVTTTVGATMLTDTAALLVLAVVAGAAEGTGGPRFIVQLAGLLALFALAVLGGLPRVGRWFFRRSPGDSITEFAFVLAAVFVCAVGAELIGVEAIIGAFLAGLGLNRLIPEQSTLMNRIQFVGDALFIPFFLIATGMLVDLHALVTDPASWAVAGLMGATVVVTKAFAAWTTKPLFGYGHEERQLVFALTVPQAAATLAAVLVGYRVGLFGTPVINGAVLMILVTCLLGPWLADRYGRRLAAREVEQPASAGARPQRILIPLANPASVASLMEVATLIRDPRQEQPLYPVSVAQDGPNVEAEVARSETVLAEARLCGTLTDVAVHPITRVEISVAQGLRRAAQETRSTVVVMGWDDLPMAERFIFGTISDRLLGDRRVALVLCRLMQPPRLAQRLILVLPPLVEREAGFDAALHLIRTLGRQIGTPLVVLADPDQLVLLRQRIEQTRPPLTMQAVPLESWDDMPEVLDQLVRPDDLLLLLSARRGAISWHYSLDRLPHVLARHFATTSLIITYLAEESEQVAVQA